MLWRGWIAGHRSAASPLHAERRDAVSAGASAATVVVRLPEWIVSMERTPRYAIGHVFTTRGRAPKRCTVTDILTTRSAATGEIVKLRYVAERNYAL